MINTIELTLTPREASDSNLYQSKIARELKVSEKDIKSVKIIRKSVDARSRNIKVILRLQVVTGSEEVIKKPEYRIQDVRNKPEVIIVGAGPAGLFAALRLIELGLRPIIIERGKDVTSRKVDVAKINTKNILLPDSNYCFGEGGAGTFSDGKLYTRSKKRGNVSRIIDLMYLHGASEEIMYEAHPHIGTNKLPEIIRNIRNTIEQAGGYFNFNARVCDFIVKNNVIKGVVTVAGDLFEAKAIILATGHSARDIYHLLNKRGITLEAKPFAMGLRVEHPQNLIDQIQYHSNNTDYLPPASYILKSQINGRGVYSFCMCPGGYIVPAATDADQVVVNGMSPSTRNSPYANSGIVVEIRDEDYKDYLKHDILAGMMFQESLEKIAAVNGGGSQVAPAQRLDDFVKGRLSPDLPDTSYNPGIISSPLHHWLPIDIAERLQLGFKYFGKKMRGFNTNEAVVLGVESRTSSPVRIPRDEKMQHCMISGLFPCGEGAGYAGGIVSSAVDGDRCAEMVAQSLC